MTRSKVKLVPFEKESQRRVSSRKRKKGLMKKLEEITILCGVEACAIISSPFEDSIEVWPSHAGVHGVLTRFRNMALTDQTKKMYNLESFTIERINKTSEQLRTLTIDNRRSEMDQLINECFATGRLDYRNDPQILHDMGKALAQNLQEVNMRIQSLRDRNPVEEANGGLQIGEGSGPRNITNVENVMAGGGGMQTGEGSTGPGNMTLDNITNVENFMESGGGGGGEEPIFPVEDAALLDFFKSNCNGDI